MATEPDVLTLTQIGVESTHGTPVTAAKRFRDLTMELEVEMKTRRFRAPGNKTFTTAVKDREWSIGRYNTEVLGFNSLVYILGGLFGHGTVSQIATSGIYTWPISPNNETTEAYRSFTVQQGRTSSFANEANFVAPLSLNIEYGEETMTMNGDLIGRALDPTASLDTVTNEIDEVPLALGQIDWFINNSYGAIGTTQWTNVLRATLSLPQVRAPKFVQNSNYRAFEDLVEIPREGATLTLVAEYNSQTRTFVDEQKADTLPTRYIQTKVTGPTVSTSNYLYKNNLAVKLERCRPLRNVQRTYAWEFVYSLMDDEAMGRDIEWTIQNKLSAL